MSLINSFKFTKTVIDWDKFATATRNQYRVVSSRPYTDKKGVLPDGLTLTVTVLTDDMDYGIDKNGKPRENNVFQNFEVTILNRNHAVKKGDLIRLHGFDEEHSFVIGFNMILRFADLEILQPPKKAIA